MKSTIWKYFEKSIDCFKQCKLCSDKVKASNTTNLWTHLETHHKSQYSELKKVVNNQSQLIINDEDISSSSKSTVISLIQSNLPPSEQKIDKLITNMIIIDSQPLSMVEDEGFNELINGVCPKYKIPCGNYFASSIEKNYNKKLENLIEILKNS
jgi:hypothetical protein